MPTQPPIPILIFSKTSAYHHTSIPTALTSLRTLSTNSNLAPTLSSDANIFHPSTLSTFRVILLLQCTGAFLDAAQESALRDYVRAGGGVVAVHAAAAGMLESEWYGRLIGAHFASHPEPEVGTVVACCADGFESGSRDAILGDWEGERSGWMDEWYVFKTDPRANSGLRVLLEGGVGEEKSPLAWCHDFEGARVFYTALGHFDEAYGDEWFMGLLRRGILWAAGEEVGDVGS